MTLVVKLVKKDDSSTANLFKDTLIDSFNHSYKQYSYKEEVHKDNLQLFWEQIRKESVYIVLRQNKAIGFFFLEPVGKNLIIKNFLYPRACPLALRSLLRCGLYSSMLHVLEVRYLYNCIHFETWHPALVSLAKTIIPSAVSTMYSPSNIDVDVSIGENEMKLFEWHRENSIKDITECKEFSTVV